MMFNGINNIQFFISLGYVTIISSLITMILMQIVKIIMKKKKIIDDEISSIEKDVVLSKIGRIIAIIVYSILYICNEFYLCHKIILDGTLLTGLLSGSAITLTLAKGFYTAIKQYNKKQNIFEKLKCAEVSMEQLKHDIQDLIKYESDIEKQQKVKWILTSKD